MGRVGRDPGLQNYHRLFSLGSGGPRDAAQYCSAGTGTVPGVNGVAFRAKETNASIVTPGGCIPADPVKPPGQHVHNRQVQSSVEDAGTSPSSSTRMYRTPSSLQISIQFPDPWPDPIKPFASASSANGTRNKVKTARNRNTKSTAERGFPPVLVFDGSCGCKVISGTVFKSRPV